MPHKISADIPQGYITTAATLKDLGKIIIRESC